MEGEVIFFEAKKNLYFIKKNSLIYIIRDIFGPFQGNIRISVILTKRSVMTILATFTWEKLVEPLSIHIRKPATNAQT